MVFSEESTVGAFLLRARREGLRDFGACMSPHTAWLILQGIETLPLRMERHVEQHAQGGRVPGRRTRWSRSVGYPDARIASRATRSRKRLLPRGCGSVFSFDLQGQPRAGQAVHRGAASCSPTWPTSATAARS